MAGIPSPTPDGIALNLSAAQLREAFDSSFAVAETPESAACEDYLGIWLGPALHAVVLSEVACVTRLHVVTPVPTHVHAFMGLAAFKGDIVPVYDLRAWLGLPMAQPPKWLIKAAAKPVALAFDAFEGQWRLPRDAYAANGGAVPEFRHIEGMVRTARGPCPVISLSSVLQAVEAAAHKYPEPASRPSPEEQ